MEPGYFVNSPALPGPLNMAIDSLLMAEAARLKAPILRVYSWERPTLSLGYFQKLEDVADAAFMHAHGVDCVRRVTGGGAILHDREVTLSLSLHEGHPWLAGTVNDSYLAITRPLLEALRGLGVPAEFRGDCANAKTPNCFAGSACPDIVLGGHKLFGSAQRRKAGAVMTHGSLLLEVDPGLWRGVFGPKLGQGFTGVGIEPGREWGRILCEAYRGALKCEWQAEGEIFKKIKEISVPGQAWERMLS